MNHEFDKKSANTGLTNGEFDESWFGGVSYHQLRHYFYSTK